MAKALRTRRIWLGALRGRLPAWLVDCESPEQTDGDELASADTEIDTADKVAVGSKG